LTLIDWQMARVGDPLYDLARHMYLERSEPAIRMRMFDRWASGLDARYTRDHLKDYDVYHGLETVRSAYIDLDRQFTGAGAGTPYVNQAVESYENTLHAALRRLGVPGRPTRRD
ncbi:MAG: phosphotransferase, partial [Catenulispora sp.]